MPGIVLRLRDVSKRFGAREALRGLSLELLRGEIVGLLGPNGSGKTTALRIAAGVLAFDHGVVEPKGRALRLGYLPEGVPLYDALRVDDMLDFVARAKGLHGDARTTAVDEAIAACDLTGWRARRVGQLSKGTRQRVGLAQAILGAPDLLLLDEATSGLDPLQAREARRKIRDGAASRGTIFSTHVLQEAAALCDRVVILRDGRVVAEHRPSAQGEAARAGELERVFLEALDGAGSR